MKNKFNREGYATIKGGFEGQGASLEIEIPVRLMEDFSNCLTQKRANRHFRTSMTNTFLCPSSKKKYSRCQSMTMKKTF